MNSIYKILLTGLLSFSMLTVMAQGPRHEGPHHEPDVTEAAPHEGCPMHNMVPAVDFQSVKICYAPQLGAFVAIDSVECSVHLVAMKDGQLDTVGVFVTDNTHKRHDLKNILRPVSVTAMGEYIVVLVSAKSDSAYVTILDKEMKPLAKRCFSSPMYAMHREHGMLMIAGRNPYGYDINILPLHGMNFEAFENGEILSHHYRVAKQAEKIKQSDPVGTFYILDHGMAVDATVNKPVECSFKNGKISGELSGTYTVTDGTNYISMTIGDTTYKGVMINMKDEAGNNTFAISAVGDNNHSLWCVHYMND